MHIFLWNAGKKASKRSGWVYWGTFPESLFVKKRKVSMGVVLSIGFAGTGRLGGWPFYVLLLLGYKGLSQEIHHR